MTESALQQRDYKTERDLFAKLSFCWADLVFEVDQHLNVAFVEGATKAFFGRPKDDLLGSSFRDIIAPADIPMVGQELKKILQTAGRINEKVIRVVGPDGNLLWMSMSAYCLDAVKGKLYIGLRLASPEAKAAALTVGRAENGGLFDGGSFAELAADRLKKIQSAGENAEVTLVSIPAIKELQDRLDSKSNDVLSRQVGELLKANSVGGDSAAKVGDGQYSILHAAGTNVDDMIKQIEVMTKKVDPTGQGVDVETATMTMDGTEISEEDLAKGLLYTLNKFRDSDESMNIKDLTTNMSALVGEAVQEVNAFKSVVALSEFYVALQPIVQIQTGEIHHYEALCRFDAKPGESPFKTITFAEETGLIHEFDLAMAKKVVEWLAKFPRNNDKYRAAVNVSGFSIGKPSYVDALMKMLKENSWTQGKLMFEITESSRMSDLDAANNFIQNLRKRGYHVCLDDFGAGAASFQYLSVLDVDVVKLDGSAVKNAQKAAKGRAFLSALTELCRRMSVETIAEMVDTPDTLNFCRDCGCNYVQGYLFGKPSPDLKNFNPLPELSLFQKTASSVKAK
ncbi:MAG TPA: EAL domain-containing protein [Rhodospirillaceae bacterium]|nr:EAL domain-containing protein [Rhodospirillaceae bacterium]